MKNLFILILLGLILTACSKEEKLELFNPDGFAFQLDDGYELNATVRAKGFLQEEENDIYSAKLSYSVDIILPNADTLFNVDEGLIDEQEKEEILDLGIEIQIEFDNTFGEGNYIVIYNVEDNLKPQSAILADTINIGH